MTTVTLHDPRQDFPRFAVCARCRKPFVNVTHDPIEVRATSLYHQRYPNVPYCAFVPGGRERHQP